MRAVAVLVQIQPPQPLILGSRELENPANNSLAKFDFFSEICKKDQKNYLQF
jgi:hypothetical protein